MSDYVPIRGPENPAPKKPKQKFKPLPRRRRHSGPHKTRIVEGLTVHKEDYCALGPKVIRRLHLANGRWMALAQANAEIRIIVIGTVPSPWKKAR